MITSQDYKQRLLRRVTSTAIPDNWLFTDTETTEFTDHLGPAQRFRLGWCGVVRNASQRGFNTPDWDYFDNEVLYNRFIQKTALGVKILYIAGHNIFFDLQAAGFFYYFTRWGWQLKFYYDRGLTYILSCKKDGHLLYVVSTTNWFDHSLAKLGATLGLAKLDIDFKRATKAQLKTYCKRDTEIIIRAIAYYCQFIQDNDLGKFSLTKSSQAFTTFRYRFMEHKIYMHSEQHVIDLERDGYFGGRVEAFFIGTCKGGPFVSLDINSMYPYVMQKYTYPSKLLAWHKSPSLDDLAGWLSKYGVMARVTLETESPVYAVRHNKKCVFPVGVFTTVLATRGLKHALKAGHITAIHAASVYQMDDLFSAYVKYFSTLRASYTRSKNAVMVKLTKYMHNSLYGKFGQKKVVSETRPLETDRLYDREEILDFEAGGIVTITRLMNREIIQYTQDEGKNAFVAIAAHITEDARLTLWNIIDGIGPRRVLYCDTDSVKIRSKDLHRVRWPKHNTRIGALKVEDRTKTLVIGGSKNYRTDTHRHIKGIPHAARETAPGVFRFDSFRGMSTHLRESRVVGVRIDPVERVLQHTYDKGRVLTSGRVVPLRFESPG